MCGFPSIDPLFFGLPRETSIASGLGARRREEDHSTRSQTVCLLPARRIRYPLGMDSGAVRLGTFEVVRSRRHFRYIKTVGLESLEA